MTEVIQGGGIMTQNGHETLAQRQAPLAVLATLVVSAVLVGPLGCSASTADNSASKELVGATSSALLTRADRPPVATPRQRHVASAVLEGVLVAGGGRRIELTP